MESQLTSPFVVYILTPSICHRLEVLATASVSNVLPVDDGVSLAFGELTTALQALQTDMEHNTHTDQREDD